MRKLGVIVASALAVPAGVVGAATVASPGASAHGDRHLVVRATVTDVRKIHDGAGDGPAQGDRIIIAEELSGAAGTGTGGGICTVTHGGTHHHGDGGMTDRRVAMTPAHHTGSDSDHRDFAALCQGSFALPGGKISVAGLITAADFDGGGVVLPITGGTGDFFGAGGEAVVKHSADVSGRSARAMADWRSDHTRDAAPDDNDVRDLTITFHLTAGG